MKPTHLFAATALCLLVSCGEKPPAASAPPDPTKNENKVLLESVLGTAPKGEPMAVVAAKAAARPGDEITVTGRIMGHKKPFVTGRAAFIIADPSLITPCTEKPDDPCVTPWDCCCDTPEDIQKATATIQIVDAEGRVLKESLEGVGGLANLATVTVTGKVAPGSSGEALIINASALRVAP